MSKKKTTKKAPAKKTAKSAAKKATAKTNTPKSAKKAAASSPAKKATKKTTRKAPASKAAASSKNTPGTAAKSAAAPSKRAAAKKQAAPAASKKAGSRSTARKATAKADVAKSKAAQANNDEAPTIPPEADYLLDQKWLAGQREALLSERASYTSSADRLAAEAAALMADREPGDVQFDEESGEGDTIAVERDRDLALSAAARQSVSEIDAALARLDAGTYGICVVSGLPIPRERLEAIPEASMRVEHKASMF